ncbi:MAG: alanine--glyoxylate aminotransferase family protein [Deltaproteobacteria bacterium]|nr:alanine--glyoxylate aminotransferase family protein [Deltaproteobacteria bacterium]
MNKRYLLTPGPTPVPEEVLLAMAKPIIHHRAADFIPLFEEVRKGLKWLYQTKEEVLIFASSGTGAMEAAVTNTLCKGDHALVVRGGKFGERWAEICKAYGVKTTNIDVTWGEAVDPNQIREALKRSPDIKAVFVQASETSTGASHPIKEISEITRNTDILLVVDAITALGVVDLPMDLWGLDVVVTGSQKALMLPPGLAFIALSEKAWKAAEKSDLPKFYFNVKKEKKNHLTNQTAYTPAVSLVIGLQKSLQMMQKEGLPAIFERHDKLARATRAGAQAIGLELYAPHSPSAAVTSVKSPAGLDAQEIVKRLKNHYHVTIAGGQGDAKGKIFRIAHLGYYDRFDIIVSLSALEMALNDLGFSVELGRAVAAAEAEFMTQPAMAKAAVA